MKPPDKNWATSSPFCGLCTPGALAGYGALFNLYNTRFTVHNAHCTVYSKRLMLHMAPVHRVPKFSVPFNKKVDNNLKRISTPKLKCSKVRSCILIDLVMVRFSCLRLTWPYVRVAFSLQYYCNTTAILLLYYCNSTAILLLYYCNTTAILLQLINLQS